MKRNLYDSEKGIVGKLHINIPALSVGERNRISMLNLGTLVKFSRYLIAKSTSSLPIDKPIGSQESGQT